MELLFDYKIKGLLERYVDVMYLTAEFKRKVFCYPLKYCRHIIMSGSTRPRSRVGDLG